MSKPTIDEVEQLIVLDFAKDSTFTFSELKSKYLGKKGLIKDLLGSIGSQPEKERKEFGKNVNDLRKKVEKLLEDKKNSDKRRSSESESIDVTAPFDVNTPINERPQLFNEPGTLHPITTMAERALDIFKTMGFHVTNARHLDDDYNVFTALNIPKDHPARDMWDTFWTEDGLIPTTHTSAMQNRILKSRKPPIREVIMGRCYRNEATDASHEHTFYQIEGVYIDKGIDLSDLIGTLKEFMNTFYGKDVKYKIQPSYFPFVEPGLEFMVECLICGQKGCPFCGYSGWIELVPCGPVHPNVLKEGGLDPKEYSGFAWGLGLDRLVMLASQIEDIRHIHGGDLKFLTQFK